MNLTMKPNNFFRIFDFKTIYTTYGVQAINITTQFKYPLPRKNKTHNSSFKNEIYEENSQRGVISGDLLECTNELERKKPKKNTREFVGNFRHYNKKATLFMYNEIPKLIKGEIIFGIHPILLALRSKRRNFHKLYVKKRREEFTELNSRLNEIKSIAQTINLPIEEISGKILDQLSGQRPHQSVCMDCGYLEIQFHDVTTEINSVDRENKLPIWLLLHRVKDPMNLGAIIRTAYFMGVDKILSTKVDSCPLTSVVSKASSGAMEIAPFFYIDNLLDFLKVKRENGWEIIGTVADEEIYSSVNLFDFKLSKPTILIIGNEGLGLDSNMLELCTNNIKIAAGHQNSEKILSLNVSVATGIILHTILNQK